MDFCKSVGSSRSSSLLTNITDDWKPLTRRFFEKLQFKNMEGELWVSDRILTNGDSVKMDTLLKWHHDFVQKSPFPVAEAPKKPFITGYYGDVVELPDEKKNIWITRSVYVLEKHMYFEHHILVKDLSTDEKTSKIETIYLGHVTKDGMLEKAPVIGVSATVE